MSRSAYIEMCAYFAVLSDEQKEIEKQQRLEEKRKELQQRVNIRRR